MTIDVTKILPIMLYICLITLVIVVIIICIKLVETLQKVNKVLDDVTFKMNSLNGVFSIVDKTSNYASSISDKLIDGISNFVSEKLKKKKGKDIDE